MKNQTKVIAISLFGLIASIGLFMSVINPTLLKIEDLRSEVIAKKTELKQLEEQIIIFKNSQTELAQASGRESIAESLVKREDLESAILQVEEAAAATSVFQSMVIIDELEDPKKTNKAKELISGKSSLQEVPYTLTTSSDFKQFIDFLRYLEHLPHFTEVSKISLQSNTGPETTGEIDRSDIITGTVDSIFFIQKK